VELSDCDLQGIGILVTRPAHQAADLCALIESHGGRALAFPALEIGPPSEPAAVVGILQQPTDLYIFISPNAVSFARRLLDGHALSTGAKLAAVGSGTAQALQQAGFRVDLLPDIRFDSEGLLALPELSQLLGCRVVIVRGEGGRPLLGDELRARGADLVYAEVYRRSRPECDPTPLLHGWRQQVDLVTATSNEILANLVEMLGPAGWPQLHQTPLLVISERMREQAHELGFKTILSAKNASSYSIVERLCNWVKSSE
jgi:uroporphyrinogen-III synthase